MSEPSTVEILTQIGADGGRASISRSIAVEMPIAIEVNGLGYAVLMATPADLEDLAYGFLRSERLIDSPDDVLEISVHPAENGLVLRAWLKDDLAERIVERVRHRVSESSCGLCGIENLEQALRPLPHISSLSEASDAAVFAALTALSTLQPLNEKTGSVHAAALCNRYGSIIIVREDVGRHNAFDKLLGAMQRDGLDWDDGFALLSSRCSYELVEKAALANCPMLVTLSAPTSLAIERAEQCGLRLVVLARPDSYLTLE